jgi:hypothetical protein
VPANIQGATDSQCSPCGSGTLQSWWPCNVSGLCQCGVIASTTAAPITSTTAAPSSSTSILAVNPCAKCGTCTVVAGNIQGASAGDCAPCANNAQTWWPCNVSDLCKCSTFLR